jgi:sortase
MQSALNLAFSQPKINALSTLRQIVFITDGSVGNEESLMQLISNKLKNSRLFTVGIGSAPNSYFMSEAAKMGRGTFTYIGSVDQVQEKMLRLLTKLQHAWHKNLQSVEQHKPWPWADTHPIAELIMKDKSWYVLAGASGRNLAFAPAHVSSTPVPGEIGNSVIVGHRDTQFNSLKRLQKGDIIEVKTKHKRQQFKVTMLRIAVHSQLEYLHTSINNDTFDDDQPSLTLITCYPFDSLLPNPTHRYVVRAIAI